MSSSSKGYPGHPEHLAPVAHLYMVALTRKEYDLIIDQLETAADVDEMTLAGEIIKTWGTELVIQTQTRLWELTRLIEKLTNSTQFMESVF